MHILYILFLNLFWIYKIYIGPHKLNDEFKI